MQNNNQNQNNPIVNNHNNTSGSPQVDSILSVLSDFTDQMEDSTKGLKELIAQFNQVKKTSKDVETVLTSVKKGIKTTVNTLEDVTRHMDSAGKKTRSITDAMKDSLRDYREFESGLSDIQRKMMNSSVSYANANSEMNKAVHDMEQIESHLNKCQKQINKSSRNIESMTTQQTLITNSLSVTTAAIESISKELSDTSISDARRLQLKDQLYLLEKEKESKDLQLKNIEKGKELEAKKIVEAEKSAQLEQRRASQIKESIESLIQAKKESQSALSDVLNKTSRVDSVKSDRERDAISLIPVFGSFINDSRAQQKEEQETIKAFKDRIAGLNTFIQKSKDEANQQRQIAHDLRDASKKSKEESKEAAKKVAEAAQKLNDVAGSDDENLKKEAQLNYDKAKALQEEKLNQAKEQENAAKMADNIANEKENIAKEAEDNRTETENSLAQYEREKSATAKIVKALGTTLVKQVTMVASTFYDEQKQAFNRVYSALEETQNSMARQLKMDNGEYKKFMDTVDAAIAEQGLEGSLSSTDVASEVASMADVGIRDEDLLGVLGIGAAKAKAAGSTIDFTNEETLKNMQAMYNKVLNDTGSVDDAKKAVEDLMNGLIGADAYITDELKSTTALAGGMSNEIFNKAMENAIASGAEIDVGNIAQSYAELGFTAQSLDNVGGDSAALVEAVNALSEYKSYDDLPTELLALVQEQGYGRTDIQNAYANGEIDTIISDILGKQAEIYGNIDADIMGYVQNAYGNTQSAAAIQNSTGSGITGTDISGDTLGNYYNSEQSALQKGEYVSNSERMRNKMENNAYDIASMAQGEMTFGDTIINQTLTNIENLVGEIVGIIGASAMGNLGLGGMTGTGGGGGMMGALNSKFGTPTATGGAPSIGNTIGYVAGGAMMAVSYGKGWVNSATNAYDTFKNEGINADTISDVAGETAITMAENTFGDSTFMTGFGTVIGTALGGPVGAAIGGLLGNISSQLGNALAESGALDPVLDAIGFGGVDSDARKSYEIYTETFDEASNALIEAADALSESANAQMDSLSNEKALSQQYNETQKAQWLIQQGIMTQEEANLASESEINTAFESAFNDYFERETAKAEKEALKASYIYDNADALANMEAEIASSDVDFDNMTDTELQAFTGKSTAFGDAAMDIAKYALSDEDGMTVEQAVSELTADADLDDKTKEGLAKSAQIILDNKAAYDEANATFQQRWQEILPLVKDGTYKDPIAAYVEENGVYPLFEFDPSGDVISKDENGNEIVTHTKWYTDSNGLPYLDTADGYYYSSHYENGYKTGLDYVPYDEFPALLHRGEMVLNQTTADRYRSGDSVTSEIMDISNSISNAMVDSATSTVSDISDLSQSLVNVMNTSKTDNKPLQESIDSQTTKIETILMRILEVLTKQATQHVRQPSNINKAVRGFDSNVSRINA